jgi:hypothetical protein
MADETPGQNPQPQGEIPAFRFSPKKVDDSWKEEARREREAAAKAVEAQRVPATPAAAAAPAAKEADAPAGAESEDAAPVPADSGAPAGKTQTPQEQQQTKIFLNFVQTMAQQMLMQLGEMENPFTGQAEVDIQGARYTLELLAVIAIKTKGNLNETETKAINGVIQELRQHYSAVTQEMQRQMAAQMAQQGARRPGPGGTLR